MHGFWSTKHHESVSGTSRSVCDQGRINSIISAAEVVSHVVLSSTSTKAATGEASTPIKLRASFEGLGISIKTILLALSLIKKYIHWIPQPLICALSCFIGHTFERPRRRSNCTRSWTCGVQFRHLSLFLRENRLMCASWRN